MNYKKPRRRRSARAEQADYNALGRALSRDMKALDAREADRRLGWGVDGIPSEAEAEEHRQKAIAFLLSKTSK